jgi:hypothetical protein
MFQRSRSRSNERRRGSAPDVERPPVQAVGALVSGARTPPRGAGTQTGSPREYPIHPPGASPPRLLRRPARDGFCGAALRCRAGPWAAARGQPSALFFKLPALHVQER